MCIRKKKNTSNEQRKSVQTTIIRLFLMTLVLISAPVGLSTYYIQYGRIMKELNSDAISTLNLAASAIRDLDFSKDISGGQYASTRMSLRNICQAMDMQYLYINMPDEKTNTAQFFFCVANSDEDDAKVRVSHPYKKVVAHKPSVPEKAALHGKKTPGSWRINNEYGNVFCWTIPFYDYKGKLAALITTDCLVSDFDHQIASSIFSILGLSVIILLISMTLEIWLLRKRVFLPLSKISNQMSGFASGDSLKTTPLNITSQDEIQEIADSFEKMTTDIQIYMDNQKRAAEERAQVRAQLDLARNIQYGMVPAAFHQMGSSCDVSALMRPAREVGGDFYDCFFRKDGKLCAIMADVSGKGITAALFMAMAKSTLHELLSLGLSPAEALNRANDELCAQNPEGMFVTIFAMVMDCHSGEVILANAGHNPPVLFGTGGSRIYQPSPGIALALFEDSGIENETLTLAPGEGILLYTDGITEAVSKDHTFYGLDRLTALLESAPASTQEVLSEVIGSVDAFAEGTEQFDDMTLAAVFFQGPAETASRREEPSPESADDSEEKDAEPQELSGTLVVSHEALDTLKEKLRSITDSPNLGKIILATEEAVVNIVDYSGAETIEYTIQKKDRILTLILTDDGISFDPFADRPQKDFDDFDTGGMGINLIRQIAVQAGWERKADKNRLTLMFEV